MRPNRRETISLLAGAAPAALGMLSVAGTTDPSDAQEAKPRSFWGFIEEPRAGSAHVGNPHLEDHLGSGSGTAAGYHGR
jgi:hypothetical protein